MRELQRGFPDCGTEYSRAGGPNINMQL